MITLTLFEGNWKEISVPLSLVTRDNGVFTDTINILVHRSNAPHIDTLYPGENSISLRLDGEECTKESIDAFILALGIELQRDYDNGKLSDFKPLEQFKLSRFNPTVEFLNKIDKLRIEYLQPIMKT